MCISLMSQNCWHNCLTLFLMIYLFLLERVRMREREKYHQKAAITSPGPGKARTQELHLVSHLDRRVQYLRVSSAALPGTLTGSKMGSGAAGTQIGAHKGCGTADGSLIYSVTLGIWVGQSGLGCHTINICLGTG